MFNTNNLIEYIYREVNKISEGTNKNAYKKMLMKYFEEAQIDLNLQLNELKSSYNGTNCDTINILLYGLFKLFGIIDNEDNEFALKLFKEAANKKDGFSNYYLGLCFKYGLGTAKNVYKLTKFENFKALGFCRNGRIF